MKELKPELLKRPTNLTAINKAMDPKEEIELLKKKVKEWRTKYDSEKKINKNLNNYYGGLNQKIWQLQEINKKERIEKQRWQKFVAEITSLLETATKNYCDILSRTNNLSSVSHNDIEYQKAELETMANHFSSLIKKSDLLGEHGISEFLNNKN